MATTVLEGIRTTAERAETRAARAEDTAKVAADRALDVYQRLGQVSATAARTEGKVDDLISRNRRTELAQKKMTGAVLEMAEELRRMRPQMASFTELEGTLTEIERKKHVGARRRKTAIKWAKRVALAFLIGIAGAAGTVSVAAALQKCGVHLPAIESHQ